jgi:mannose/fructose/N-acetylgalactosamine-specific phosphotransferase system component IIC
MKKIIEFIKKYKAEILIALGAVSSIIASISTMSDANATICSISIAIIAVIIAVLKNGFTDTTITIIANAIKIIIDEINKDKIKINTVAAEKELTVEDIKEMLKAEVR